LTEQSNKFVISIIDAYAEKWWQSEDARYYENAHILLVELKSIAKIIKKKLDYRFSEYQ